MRLLALDPGGTTGWATVEPDRNTVIDIWEWGQLGPDEHHEALWILLCTYQPDVLIYERFKYQRRQLDAGVSVVLDSVEYIGVVKIWMAAGRLIPVELVPQEMASKEWWTDDKLKRVNLYKANARHANDATRHLLYYLMTHGVTTYIDMLKPQE